jgi:two-component system, LytTR family, sensor kinase
MGSLSSKSKRWLWAGGYVAFWTALVLLTSAETYVMQQRLDKPIAWSLALRRSSEEVYTFAVLVLGILWFCHRFPLEPGKFWRWFARHMGVFAVFAASYVAIVSWLLTGQRSVQTGQILHFGEALQRLALTCTLSNVVHYWIVVVADLGWQYYKRYRERERQASALATELVQARLQALRMQLNPHFLFNTLNTVLALIHERPEAADRMLVRLSQLLRRTLDCADTQEVPLREEIQFLKLYLEIEEMRFPDRLTVTFDIPKKTEGLLVPQLILQPLVENALRHGILPREEAGRITISARVQDSTLELAVRDSGIGLRDGAASPLRDGIGLSNVRSRLSHLYGSAQQFAVRNAERGGAEAVISIPCCTMPKSQGPQVIVVPGGEAQRELEPLPAAVSAKPNCC